MRYVLLAVLLASFSVGMAADRFHKGITLYTYWKTESASETALAQSLAGLAATGADWVGVIVVGSQPTPAATTVTGATDAEDARTAAVIARAHKLGLRVMLKIAVEVARNETGWHGDIGKKFTTAEQWQAWFASYGQFARHYAALAAQNSAELFCIGTELEGATGQTDRWRALVAEIRQTYPGPLTYSSCAGGEETAIAWWEALDYIGVSAYYELSASPEATVEQLAAAWTDRGYLATLETLATRVKRPVLFTEIGYRSVRGAPGAPWDWACKKPLDLANQARAYDAAFRACADRPWLAGMFWWMWSVDPRAGGPRDTGYAPTGKPAEAVLRRYYAQPGHAVTW